MVEAGALREAATRCSVVVSTRDRPEILISCLEAIRELSSSGMEVVVVDSAPRKFGARDAAEAFGARYLRLDRPGLSRARNEGARWARGETLVFLDDDVVVQKGCIEALLAPFADPRVAAAGGRILLEGGDDGARQAFEAFGGFDPGPEPRSVDRDTPGWFELVNFGGLGSGAMMAIRRSAFDGWAGFDERLGRGAALDAGEEMHAYFSLVERGHRVVYTPDAVAYHPGPASMQELRARLLHGAAVGSAYLFLLLVEHPAHRAAVFRFALEALRGAHREWRPRPVAPRGAVVPSWRLRLAWLAGPLLYARMRIREGGPHPVSLPHRD